MDCAYFADFLDTKADIAVKESSLRKEMYFGEAIRVSQSQLIFSGICELLQ